MIKKPAKFEKQSYVPLFLVLFGLIFVRYCYYGFEYFYQLDDYIQYHNYTAYNTDLGALMTRLGLLSARPLAGLCDLFVWSRFYGHMIFAVGIISTMYAASAVFLHKVFSKHFGTGYLFFIVFALLPLGFEGSYWVSASSRIVVGLFFASVSIFCFDRWCDEGKKKSLVLFAVLQLAAFCFYEQILLLSGALTLVVMLLNEKGSGKRRAAWGIIMFVNAALYLFVTKLMPTGVYGARAEMFMPWQEKYVEEVFTPLLTQLREVFIGGFGATLGKGLLRGARLMLAEPRVLYILAVGALCVLLFTLVKKAKREDIHFFAELFSGLFLALAPLVLFFFLKSPWFGARNAVCSFCGLALIADALFDLVFGRLKSGRTAEAILVSVFALMCCVASVSELHDYRETTIADTHISTAAASAFENVDFDKGDTVWLLNVDASYVSDGNFFFHEHGYGVASSEWALTGAIRAFAGRGDIPDVSPISVYRHFPVEKQEIGSAKAFCYMADGVVPVSLVGSGAGSWRLISKNGEILGTLTYSDGGVWLKMS